MKITLTGLTPVESALIMGIQRGRHDYLERVESSKVKRRTQRAYSIAEGGKNTNLLPARLSSQPPSPQRLWRAKGDTGKNHYYKEKIISSVLFAGSRAEGLPQ